VYPGNYEDYIWRKQGGAEALQERIAVSPAASQPGNGNQHGGAPAENRGKRLNPIKRKQMEDRIRQLEEQISRVEAAIARLEAELQNFVSAEQTQRQSQELERHKGNQAELIAEWESISASLQECE